jgi:type IV pilus assembly protein PilY1
MKHSKHTRYQTLLAAALVLCCGTPYAEDIDLFVHSPSGTGLPNVLFIVDNTANWTPAFENEISALISVFDDLPPTNDDEADIAKFNIGIMFAAETGSLDSNIAGGYVRAAMRPMTKANKAKYAAMLAALDVSKDKGNGGQSSLVMAEAYHYFSGGTPYSGNDKAKADYKGNTAAGWSGSMTTPESTAAMQAIYALEGDADGAGGNALSSKSATSYNSPVASGCTKNFIIYISNGPSQDNNSVLAEARRLLAAAGGDTTQISLSPSGSQSNVSDEWARFMYQDSGLTIATYTIDVDPVLSGGQGPGWSEVLKSMADKEHGGNGRYVAVSSTADSGEIKNAVKDALSEIQAINSVFASVSLPVSVNHQGTYLNQVYVGMFRPDEKALPRWMGNVKQYKLGLDDSSQLRLLDANSKSAINGQTGFVTECARSFWSEENEYWAFNPQGGCLTIADSPISDAPDGNVVEKGAQGNMLRSQDPEERTLKTCDPVFTSCTALEDFADNNTDISQVLLGAADATERTNLINWARGYDIDDENGDDLTTDMRASAHGDIVHSRPVAVDFGTEAAPQVVVFYGGNDGVFHAINGNRTGAFGGADPGHELWAFMPPEFYGNIKRLRDNAIQVSFPNITTGSPLPKPYGIDGAITAHKDASNAWIYAGMRRGGRALYAFNADVSDPTDITLKWKLGCGDTFQSDGTVSDANCTTGFENIGQTWSAAKVFKASGYDSGASPMLIMGGGYDPCEDRSPNTCSSTKGNSIYVLDADTGTLLKEFPTARGVAADVVVVPDTTGLAKYAYAVDLGGNIYRVDIGGDAPANWTSVKIASLGCDTPAICTESRKFMFAPDVLTDGTGYVLLLGSGDREKPRNVNNTVDNYFFMVKDQPADATWLTSETTNCGGAATLCTESLLGIFSSATPSAADLGTKKGWYLAMQPTEQVVTSAITIFGTVTFSTHAPTASVANACSSDLGTARVYNISYANAESANGTIDPNNRYEELPPDIGLPPSPVAGMVTLDNGQTVPFCIGCSETSPLESEEPEIPATGIPGQSKRRIYWYLQQ